MDNFTLHSLVPPLSPKILRGAPGAPVGKKAKHQKRLPVKLQSELHFAGVGLDICDLAEPGSSNFIAAISGRTGSRDEQHPQSRPEVIAPWADTIPENLVPRFPLDR
jgi:hypothetical protein